MQIKYHKNFEKRFKKLDKKLREKVTEKIGIFIKTPLAKELYNHPLTGNMARKRAFSVTGNYRVVFEEIDDYVLVIMLDVGTHNQVY